MSYSVNVYSASRDTLSRESLRTKMNSCGWDILFQQGYFGNATVAVAGPMQNEVIVGWRTGKVSPDSVCDAIEGGDSSTLHRLYTDQILAGCEMWVECPYEIAPSELEEMAEYKAPEEIASIRRAKSRYAATTSAGRSSVSVEFQEHVARSIAELTDGWLENPETGEVGMPGRIPIPTPQQEALCTETSRRPWYTIACYSIFAAMGLLALTLGRHPLNPKNWLLAVFVLLGAVAFGLYRANRWAWTAAIGLSGVLTIAGLLTLLSRGVSLHTLIPVLIHVSIIRELLSSEVRARFDRAQESPHSFA